MTGAADFLAAVWGARPDGSLDGVHFIAEPAPQGWKHHPVSTIAEAVSKALEISGAVRNAYFACAEYLTADNRKGENVNGACLYWADIDCGAEKAASGKGYPTKKEAMGALAAFCKAACLPEPSIVVDSGNGLHCYWQFADFIPREEWQRLARKLKALTAIHGLLADPSRTADIASVLRVPGTMNWKDTANPKNVTTKRLTAPVVFSEFAAALDRAMPDAVTSAANAFAAAIEKRPPPPETTEEIALAKSMLAAIPADCDRETWRNVVWAVMATGWTYAEDLAREWSMTAPDAFDEGAFQKVVGSYKPGGGIGFGSLFHIAKQHGWVEPDSLDGERFTGSGGDVKNGQIFAKVHRNKLLHVHETNEWLQFDMRAGWIGAHPGEEDRAGKAVLSQMRDIAAKRYREAPEDPKTKRLMAHVERTSKANNLRAMIEMAKSEAGMTVRLSEFDTDPMLLGVANGVLNLRAARLLPVSPDVLVSKRCNVAYEPGAECPIFRCFMDDVQPDEEMRAFLQRWAGYCLTGSVNEQKFIFAYGGGANGKSVFIELLAWLLGDYARKIATEMLMHHQRSPQGPSPDIVALKGVRLAYANETEEGRRLAEARVKDMTGGDTLTGRVPYGKADITFSPSHKLMIVGNHRPEITDNSFGMWRRVALTPFDVTIPEDQRDPQLLDKLKSEGAGILNWVLEGLRQWQKTGLQVPKKIAAATAAYRDEQDLIGEWIADHCDTGAGCIARKEQIYKAYRNWSLANGHHPLAQGRLTRRLNERGYRLQPDKRAVSGLALNKEGDHAARSM